MGSKPSTDPASKLRYELEYPVDNGDSFVTYYINLDHRTDRRQEIETELERMQITPFTRFPAIKHKKGAVGCTQSHVECLQLGIASGADHILVFEDDFVFRTDMETVHQVLQDVIQIDYDVFLLGYCFSNKREPVKPTTHKKFNRIQNGSCTHGYMVSRRYAKKLLENFAMSVALLFKTGNECRYSLDQFWKMLQFNDKFLGYEKGPLGFQREGFSDIENIVKHN